MTNNYLIKDYEHKVNGRVLCKQHGLLRCSECAYIDDLEKQNKRYREAFVRIVEESKHHDWDVGDVARKALEGEE